MTVAIDRGLAPGGLRYTFATRASAAVKSTAPKIHISGGGACDSMNTRTVG